MILASGDALGLKAKKLRGVFMRLGDDANAPVLDLVQFIDPPTQGQPYQLNNVGICRIAFTVDDIDKTYAVAGKKVDFLAPLKKISGPAVRRLASCVSRIRMGPFLRLISGM
jgi:hypothetical protein